MSQVIPMRRPALQPTEAIRYQPITPEARQAFAALEGRVGALRRIFAGAFASTVSAAEIDRLCGEVKIEAQRVSRLAK